ncbi:hypothetical protein Sgly_2995 [Syntrophobotulus glycolicus DSM 8271]|uniref:Lipoprotein n=1 Tax=Syntrophobotulus glycolicus (strain DSM 8271 / FlGlyR) TaxID=645991 RepID=F0SZU3_SYNGF|nr:hypothetical protein [Syntrophobotulus glycolicus]ADY57264.1 hypothetical protein Sgly_2995 [Syntrophobotulus glycolicus DSM 8271]
MKKSISLFLVVSLLFAIAVGCSRQAVEDKEPPAGQNQTQTGNKTDETADKVDTAVSSLIQKEAHVLGAKVSETGGVIVVAVTMEAGTSEAEGKSLVDKYLKVLQEKYPEQRINIQVVADGKSLVKSDTGGR